MKRLHQIIFTLVIIFNCSSSSSLRTKRQGFLDLTQLSRCRTPLGDVGICLNIKNCKSLMELLLKERHRPEVTDFLRASKCGYENRDPKVCCTEIPDISVIVRQPQTTPEPVRPTSVSKLPSTTTPSYNNNQNKYSVFPQPLECGGSLNFNLRVVGGTNASLGAWPWVAALGYRSTRNPGKPVFLCGGSLINNKHILTAAHCVYNKNTLYMVRIGDLNLYSDNDGAHPVDALITKTIVHENYNPTTFVNDIAVLRIHKPVKYTQFLKPICLPVDLELRSKDLVNRKPFIVGWGTISFNGPSSEVLQQLQIAVVSEAECKRAFSTFKTAVIDKRVVCAGYLRGGKDSCKGDSGGPLMNYEVVNKAGVFYQIGVVSYGYKCAEPGFPGVYTRVSEFIDWIADALQE